jgi:hypothetical protein
MATQLQLVIVVVVVILIRKYVSTMPGNHEVKELQKTAILGTPHTHIGMC